MVHHHLAVHRFAHLYLVFLIVVDGSVSYTHLGTQPGVQHGCRHYRGIGPEHHTGVCAWGAERDGWADSKASPAGALSLIHIFLLYLYNVVVRMVHILYGSILFVYRSYPCKADSVEVLLLI